MARKARRRPSWKKRTYKFEWSAPVYIKGLALHFPKSMQARAYDREVSVIKDAVKSGTLLPTEYVLTNQSTDRRHGV